MSVRFDEKPPRFTPDRLSFWEGLVGAVGFGAFLWLCVFMLLL